MFSFLLGFFLTIYLLIIFLVFILFYICLPRLKSLNKKIPNSYYLFFYVISSLILNFVFFVKPMNSIFIHFIILLLSNFIGVRLRVMGLTGQICSGKSTVAKYMTDKYKANVIDIDKLNREVLGYDDVKRQIKLRFGDDVFDENNELNRPKMRKIIYADSYKKRQLESIIHGKVFCLLIKIILKEKLFYNTKYVFIENAILLRFKALQYICYPIIAVVTNNQEEVLRRVISRDKCDKSTALNILENQMKIEEFVAQSDFVIFNDEGKDRLEEEIDKILKVIG